MRAYRTFRNSASVQIVPQIDRSELSARGGLHWYNACYMVSGYTPGRLVNIEVYRYLTDYCNWEPHGTRAQDR